MGIIPEYYSTLKLIIASLVIFSLVILFLFALFPADISVSRVIQIRTTQAELKHKIADLRQWKSWNEMLGNALHNKDSASTKIDSAEIQSGVFRLYLQRILPDTLITRWQYGQKSFIGNYNISDLDGRLVVEWVLHFHVKWYPWEKLSSMFYDKELGPVMEKSLLNLQQELEHAVHP